MLQLVHPSFQELALHLLVDEQALDTSQGLGDGLVLLLEAFESPVDLVEVPEDFPLQLREPLVDVVEPLVHPEEPLVHPDEPPVHRGKLAPQELDELLVLGGSHRSCLPRAGSAVKGIRVWTF